MQKKWKLFQKKKVLFNRVAAIIWDKFCASGEGGSPNRKSSIGSSSPQKKKQNFTPDVVNDE